jgi:hypothetical protein
VIGEVAVRYDKEQAAALKRLGYRRHPQGAGWVRQTGRAWFPRFHLYTTSDWQAGVARLDLHLDLRHHQDEAFSRTPAAVSDGAEVAAELQRIVAAFAGGQGTGVGVAAGKRGKSSRATRSLP